jgi:hypothetical protein
MKARSIIGQVLACAASGCGTAPHLASPREVARSQSPCGRRCRPRKAGARSRRCRDGYCKSTSGESEATGDDGPFLLPRHCSRCPRLVRRALMATLTSERPAAVKAAAATRSTQDSVALLCSSRVLSGQSAALRRQAWPRGRRGSARKGGASRCFPRSVWKGSWGALAGGGAGP